MKIAVAQLGARMHYAVPRIFHEAGMLERLFTDCYIGNKPWLEVGLRSVFGLGRLRHQALERLLGRKDSVLPAEKVTSFDRLGIDLFRRLGRTDGLASIRRVLMRGGETFARKVALADFGASEAFWGFNGASLEIFEVARSREVRCILEQTIAPISCYNRLLRAEIERWPGWQPGLAIENDVAEIERRERAEWELADLIICGSEFVLDGIRECGGPVEKCRVVAYGVDLRAFVSKRSRQRLTKRPLRLLFAGEVGLRKGAPWLLEVCRRLGPGILEIKFAGRVALAGERLSSYHDVATFLGPVPRSQMGELFAWADVLVLPSNCEGSATVTYEAVASGLPVICTPNTGALLSRAITVVPPNDLRALSDAILAHASVERRATISDEVREEYGLDAYASRLLATIRELEPNSLIEVAAK